MKTNEFIKTSLIGGLCVILPIIIIIVVFNWLFNLILRNIQPLTQIVISNSESTGMIANTISVIIIIAFCFIVGAIVKTTIGRYIHNSIEKILLKNMPGYNLAKDTIKQFIGKKEMPFSCAVLVKLFDNGTKVTGFITDTHSDGSYTVFVPTGPNPTSGNIFHVDKERIFKLETSVEQAMKRIITCGSGSSDMMEEYIKSKKK